MLQNKRPDGKSQYKVTLPKGLAERAWINSETVMGEFSITRVRQRGEKDSISCTLYRFRNQSESYQRDQITADWHPLTCPYCGDEVEPPLFPEGSNPISHQLTHSCGSTYYVDRSDTRCEAEWKEITGTRVDWKIIHNYHILLGKVASNLPPDFDVVVDDSKITHVVFLKPRLEINGVIETLFESK